MFSKNILAQAQLKTMESGLTQEEYAKRWEDFLSLYYELRNKEDNEHLQGIVDAPFLGLNGVIYFNEKVYAFPKKIPIAFSHPFCYA